MNRYGWNERAINPLDFQGWAILCAISIMSFCGVLVMLLVMWKHCFMSKEKALRLYDEKDMKDYGHHIGKQIAQNEGRLPN